MKNNPWAEIENKGVDSQRADLNLPFNVFWSLGPAGEYQMRINHADLKDWPAKKISLTGIEIRQFSLSRGFSLVLSLNDKMNKDIFYNICCDLIESSRRYETEKMMLTSVYNRLQRWQEFFRKNINKLLSVSEQRGLFGELSFLRNYLLKKYSASDALSFWQGPIGGQQDFSIGRSSIEVKTKTGTSSSLIQISSIEQLDFASQRGYLLVLTINAAESDAYEAFSLNSLVKGIKQELKGSADLEMFENLLLETGYIELEEYSKMSYVVLNESFYRVEEGFPRITSAEIPPGIISATYQIDIKNCQKYHVAATEIEELRSNQIQDEYGSKHS